LQDSSLNVKQNARAISRKYQRQIDWRRNKVKKLLIRGHSQYEISSILHISQPTVSRDINYFRRQSYLKDRREYGRDVLDSYQRTVFGLTELLTKTWEIIDNPKTDAKQRIKAITVA
jgi:hypothetical protein